MAKGASQYVDPKSFETVREAELRHMGKALGASSGEEPSLIGLAVSGGGIRSASFGLGLLQALVAGRALKNFDYLSTVSGGGYLGSCLTWFLNQGLPGQPGPDSAGTDPENFPLGQARAGKGAGGGANNSVLDFLRQHGSYMVPGEGLNWTSMMAVLLRSVTVSLFIYGGLLTATFALLLALGLFGVNRIESLQAAEDWVVQQHLSLLQSNPELLSPRANPLLTLATGLAILFAVSALIYGVITSVKWVARVLGFLTTLKLKSDADRYRLRTTAQRCFGYLMAATLVSAVLGSIPEVRRLLDERGLMGSIAGGSTGVGAVLGVLQARAQQSEGFKGGLPSTVRLYLAVGLLLFGLLLGAFILADKLPFPVCLALGAASFGLGLFTNMNYVSLHRMYRDRLMETFLPNLESVVAGEWAHATDADSALLDSMCQEPNTRPYHLINTNVVLVDSDRARFRGRGGDSFLLSPLFCGSEATGWRESAGFMKGLGRGMTLPTAMAISGAAANPNAGVAGQGLTRSIPVSILMSLLNLRLGYWAPNPMKGGVTASVPANFILPGLFTLFGRNLEEQRRMVQLTDGGHFENLALYELIRRRVGTIVVSDGGCDPDFAFADLANAIERVRVDFGVKIDFHEKDEDLRGLVPGEANHASAPTGHRFPLAERGWAAATIHYPPDKARNLEEEDGLLLYVKTTLIPNLPMDIYSYKQAHETFPDEPTSDQFFNEAQMEAYRELGYHIGWQLLESKYGEKLGAIEEEDEATNPS